MRLSATNTEPIEHGHTGMVSTAKQREKRNGYFFFFYYIHLRNFSTKSMAYKEDEKIQR